jgi:hypothetical protein
MCSSEAGQRTEEAAEGPGASFRAARRTRGLSRGIYGSRRKLAATCRKVSRRARVAWRKRRKVFRKIRTQGNCGPQKELAGAGRKMIRCAGVPRRKGHGRNEQNKDDVAPRSTKRRTLEERER